MTYMGLSKINKRTRNSVDPDETARWPSGMKGFRTLVVCFADCSNAVQFRADHVRRSLVRKMENRKSQKCILYTKME